MVVMTTISTALEEVILRVAPSSMMTSSKVVETSVTTATTVFPRATLDWTIRLNDHLLLQIKIINFTGNHGI